MRKAETVCLLDSSMMIALHVEDHTHHRIATDWLVAAKTFAVCPVTQGALVRAVVRLGETAETARAMLDALAELDGYAFWPDSLDYRALDTAAIRGHGQVTDAYLVGLAALRGSRIVTLDTGLAAVWPMHAELLE